MVSDLEATAQLDDARQRLLAHPLYAAVREPADVRVFMRHHVFCVWDFQSLLKALQRRLTCVEVPWLPTADTASRRLVNEIVLAEESDEDGAGGHTSHFELYLSAMRDAEADVGPIERFLAALRSGQSVDVALRRTEVPQATAAFVRLTLHIAEHAETHCLGAAFALGREDLIPGMFVQFLERLGDTDPQRFGRFAYYLRRHVDLDGDVHGPQARRLVARLCGGDSGKEREARATALQCLEARRAVWDEILATITNSSLVRA